MRRAEAEAYAASGQECLRLRSRNDWGGTRVRIKGIGYRRNRYQREPVASSGNGVLVDLINSVGQVTGWDVYPLGQLHAKTLAEHQAERARRQQAEDEARAEARRLADAEFVEARHLVEQLQVGDVRASRYGEQPYIHLSLADARHLAAVLAEHDATFVPDMTDPPKGTP